MANSTDPDQLASSEANWSGSTLFVKTGYIRVQQDKGLHVFLTKFQAHVVCSVICYLFITPYFVYKISQMIFQILRWDFDISQTFWG